MEEQMGKTSEQPTGVNIRTITVGVECSPDNFVVQLTNAGEILNRVYHHVKKAGYIIQTVRICTNSFHEYLDCSSKEKFLKSLEAAVAAVNTSNVPCAPVLFNIGPCHKPEYADFIVDAVLAQPQVTSSLLVPERDGLPDRDMAREACDIITSLAAKSPGGAGNFNFAALFNCSPGIPFFPAAYHAGDLAFSLGVEAAPLLTAALLQATPKDYSSATQCIQKEFTDFLKPLDQLCQSFPDTEGVKYGGIDSSPAPSPYCKSVVDGYAKFCKTSFGSTGSLALSSCITAALKTLPIKLCGYSGLMFPPLEDIGLAKLAEGGAYSITELLQYSAVCGIGLDTVPIPGNVTIDDIEPLLLDVGALAYRLRKPLSCRLFPVPGKKAGDVAIFDNPHLCDCPVFEVK